MGKTAIGLAILLFLVLAGLLLAPQFMDLNRWKEPIAAELAARIGRPVELGGPLSLSLLPSPTLTARDVRLANPPGAAVPDMVRLRALEVKPALWPLLWRRIELRSATFLEPEIDLERLPNGEGNWQFRGAGQGPAAPSDPRTEPDGFAITIGRVVIENGTVIYRSGAVLERFEHVEATLALGGPSGPFQAAGELLSRGAALQFEASCGRVDASQVSLQATLTTKPAAQARLDATLTAAAEGWQVDGKLQLAAEDFQAVAATLAHARMPAELAQPFALAADLGGSLHALDLRHIALDLGPAHGEGALHIEAGTPIGVTVQLSLGQLDFDRWFAATKETLPPAASFGNALFALPPLSAAALVPPDGIEARIDLAIGTVLWRNGLIRDARLAAKLIGGQLTLDRFAVALPGGTDLSLSGNGTIAADGFHAQGAAKANADDFRSLLAWLGIASDGVPGDRLRKASLTSHLTLAGDRLDLSDTDGMLDSTRFSAAAIIVWRARPGIGLRLAADRVNLDAYLPQGATAPGNAPPPTDGSSAAPHPPAGFDANVDARVEALTWRGQPFSEAHFAGSAQNGEVTIRDLSIGDFAGATAQLSGVIEGWNGAVPKGHLTVDMHGPAFERVLRLAHPDAATETAYGEFRLGGGLRSDGESLALDAELGLFGGRAHVVGTVAPAGDKAELRLDVDHPSFAGLLSHISPAYRPAGGDLGPLTLGARVAGGLRHFTIDGLALAIGESTLHGSIGVDLGGVRPLLVADLEIGDWALDRWLPQRQSAARGDGLRRAGLPAGVLLAAAGAAAPGGWSRAPLDLGALSLVDADLSLTGRGLAYGAWRLDQPALTAALKDGRLTVNRLHGSLFDGSVEASGALDGTTVPALRAKLALRDAQLKRALGDGAVCDGTFDVDATIAGEGHSPAEIVGNLAGEAMLRGRDGSIAGIDLAAVNHRLKAPDGSVDWLALIRSGAHGRTAFSTLEGSFQITDGIALSDDIRLSAEGGEGHASAGFDLPRWTMASRVEFRLTGVAATPPLVLRLDGPIDAPRAILDVNALQEFLTQRSPGKSRSPQSPAPGEGGAGSFTAPAMPQR